VEPTGLIVVDKASGMTSHDVVARVRRLAHTRRVGHGGTLDPMATGVLIIGVGRATRLLTYVIGSGKSYRATIRLGQSTVTDDAEGELTSQAPVDQVIDADIRAGLTRLTGKIMQVPSAVSAIKIKGVRSYARVRAGEEVELAAREVTVSRLDVLGIRRDPASGPALGSDIQRGGDGDLSAGSGTIDVDVDVDCSSGTYIRALARDLGAGLGVGGHLIALRRTAVGGFGLDEAVTLDELAERADPVTLTVAEAAGRFFPRREATPDEARVLGHGGPLPAVGFAVPYAVFDVDGEVIAIVAERDGRARAEVVLAPAS
jgi:tRNA pseudouridine55 synthase